MSIINYNDFSPDLIEYISDRYFTEPTIDELESYDTESKIEYNKLDISTLKQLLVQYKLEVDATSKDNKNDMIDVLIKYNLQQIINKYHMSLPIISTCPSISICKYSGSVEYDVDESTGEVIPINEGDDIETLPVILDQCIKPSISMNRNIYDLKREVNSSLKREVNSSSKIDNPWEIQANILIVNGMEFKNKNTNINLFHHYIIDVKEGETKYPLIKVFDSNGFVKADKSNIQQASEQNQPVGINEFKSTEAHIHAGNIGPDTMTIKIKNGRSGFADGFVACVDLNRENPLLVITYVLILLDDYSELVTQLNKSKTFYKTFDLLKSSFENIDIKMDTLCKYILEDKYLVSVNSSSITNNKASDSAAGGGSLSDITQDLKIIEMNKDYNCLFSAISYLVYGEIKYNEYIRHLCFVQGRKFRRNEEFISMFDYGNQYSIDLAAFIFKRPIHIYVYNIDTKTNELIKLIDKDINNNKLDGIPIRLLWDESKHYDCLINEADFKAGIIEKPSTKYSNSSVQEIDDKINELKKDYNPLLVTFNLEKKAKMDNISAELDILYKEKMFRQKYLKYKQKYLKLQNI
jgi:hypothetical protein